MKLILASESKFKKEILNKVGLIHESIKPNEETHNKEQNPYNYVKKQAQDKLKNLTDKNEEKIYISLDTIVLTNNKIIEKPSSNEEAKNNLRLSSNNESKVVTGIYLYNSLTNEEIIDYQETIITFNNITEDDINYYIENEKDAMYASGFIIETYCSNFIKNINGSFYNILGVPVEKIYEYLQKWNISLKDLS